MQAFKEFGRRLIAPEARWRLDSRKAYEGVPHICHCLSFPLYEVSKEQRTLIGKFYATNVEAAAFISLRVLHECLARISYDNTKFDQTANQAWHIGNRIFGDDGHAAIVETFQFFQKEEEDRVKALSDQVRILVHAALFDAAAVKKIKDYEEAMAAGKELGERFPSMAKYGDEYLALMGKHWLMTAKLFEQHFVDWVVAFRTDEAMHRVMRKMGM